jgi:hypothetical protein
MKVGDTLIVEETLYFFDFPLIFVSSTEQETFIFFCLDEYGDVRVFSKTPITQKSLNDLVSNHMFLIDVFEGQKTDKVYVDACDWTILKIEENVELESHELPDPGIYLYKLETK